MSTPWDKFSASASSLTDESGYGSENSFRLSTTHNSKSTISRQKLTFNHDIERLSSTPCLAESSHHLHFRSVAFINNSLYDQDSLITVDDEPKRSELHFKKRLQFSSPPKNVSQELYQLNTPPMIYLNKSDSNIQYPISPIANRYISESSKSSVKLKLFHETEKNILVNLMDNADYILIKVLCLFSGKDLLRASHICKKFRDIILNCKVLNARRINFLETAKLEKAKLGKENSTKGEESLAKRFSLPSPRKHFQQLQNAISPKKPLVHLTMFDRFVKEGKKLPPGQVQQKCVQCQFPASVNQSECKAVCTSQNCKFVSCTRCLLSFHDKSSCPTLKPRFKSCPTASKIFAKACKKRLRRL